MEVELKEILESKNVDKWEGLSFKKRVEKLKELTSFLRFKGHHEQFLHF